MTNSEKSSSSGNMYVHVVSLIHQEPKRMPTGDREKWKGGILYANLWNKSETVPTVILIKDVLHNLQISIWPEINNSWFQNPYCNFTTIYLLQITCSKIKTNGTLHLKEEYLLEVQWRTDVAILNNSQSYVDLMALTRHSNCSWTRKDTPIPMVFTKELSVFSALAQ